MDNGKDTVDNLLIINNNEISFKGSEYHIISNDGFGNENVQQNIQQADENNIEGTAEICYIVPSSENNTEYTVLNIENSEHDEANVDFNLYKLFDSWDLKDLLERFIKKGITLKTLAYLRRSHLNIFFGDTEFGIRFQFEHHVFQWQMNNGFYVDELNFYGNAVNSTSIVPVPTTSASSNSSIDLDLYDLFDSWDLKELSERFIKKGVTLKTLAYLRKSHLNNFFEDAECGIRFHFEHHLFQWQRNNEYYADELMVDNNTANSNFLPLATSSTFNLASNSEPSSSAKSFSAQTSLVQSTKTSSADLMPLKQILLSSENCKSVINFYSQHNRLNAEIRKRLVHQIVDHYLNQLNFNVGVEICRKISNQIIDLFPTETELTYFISRGHLAPKGKLYDRFMNQKKKFRTPKINKNITEKIKNTPISVSLSDTNVTTPENLDIKTHLKHLRTPWSTVLDKWNNSSKYRVLEIIDNHDKSLDNILEEWPLYKHIQAPELINIDFTTLFPDHNPIYTKWDQFIQNITTIYRTQIKNIKIDDLFFKEIDNNNDTITSDTYNLQAIYHLPYVLPPTIASKLKKCVKPTILDAQLAFIIKANTMSEFIKKIEDIKTDCAQNKKKIQPLLVAIGNDNDYTEFYVAMDNHKFKFGSFLEALDICFKIFHIFNLEYPGECFNCWQFIQLYFYNLKTKYDVTVPSIITLMNDLKTN